MPGNINNYSTEVADELLNEFEKILPGGLSGMSDIATLSNIGIDSLLREIAYIIEGEGGEIFSFFLLMFGVTVLMSFADMSMYALGGVTRVAVGTVSALVVFSAMYPVIMSAIEALKELSAFFSALTPLIGSLLALGGGVATSASASFGMQLTLWLMGMLGVSVLPSLVTAMFAISAVGSGSDGVGARVARAIKNTFTKLLGVLTASLAGVLALQTYISVSSDSAAMRVAKYAASGMIPVVGNAVSGALATLGGGLTLTGNIIGAGAVASILITALAPLTVLLLYKLCFYICSTFLEFGGNGGSVSCISGFSGALDALISVYIMTMIIYIFEIVIAVWGGASILG